MEISHSHSIGSPVKLSPVGSGKEGEVVHGSVACTDTSFAIPPGRKYGNGHYDYVINVTGEQAQRF